MSEKVIYAFKEPRYQQFYEDLLDFIYDNGEGLLFPAIIGCLELAKKSLIEDQEEEL